MLASFHSKVAVTFAGNRLRFVPGTFAKALVEVGAAIPHGNGRVREIVLTRPASTHAHRIGNAEARATGVRFFRWVHLEASAARIVEHHPRCTYGNE